MRAWLAVVSLGFGWVASTPRAEAQSDSVQLDHYRPAPTNDDGFAISRPDDRGHLQFDARLDLDYGYNPLVIESTPGRTESELLAVVEHQLVGNLNLAMGLFERLVIFAGLPVNLLNDGSSFAGLPGGDGPGLGDVSVGARGRIFGEPTDMGAIALQLTATFPTASLANEAQRYSGEDGITFLPALLLELRPHDVIRLTGNVGARLRAGGTAEITNLRVSHELTYGIGVTVDAIEELLAFYLEMYGAQTFENIGGVGARESAPLEGILGARVNPIRDLTVGLAGGLGLTRGYGSPDLRAVLTLGWATHPIRAAAAADSDGDGIDDDADGCVHEPEDADGYEDSDGCPESDNDADGILDGEDACPTQAETVNGHEDEDGCPDQVGDTDGDGILDSADQCPSDPEDADGHEDADGCPDPDDDGDGVLDTSDECRAEAGPVENRGCPDGDRDGDAVVDRLDNCPDVAGTVEFRGCPELQRVRIEEGRLEILERVVFPSNSDRILGRSFALLRNVAEVLNQHPEITHVDVEGHTDSRGERDHNVQLSQRRAESVVRFLESAGVSRDRMAARGYGPDRPRIENATTADQHAENRRVEFNISSGSGGTDAAH